MSSFNLQNHTELLPSLLQLPGCSLSIHVILQYVSMFGLTYTAAYVNYLCDVNSLTALYSQLSFCPTQFAHSAQQSEVRVNQMDIWTDFKVLTNIITII